MLEIQQAYYRGKVDLNGRVCASVEVVPLQPEYGHLIAYIAPIQSGGFEVVKITQNQGDAPEGWYTYSLSQTVIPGSSEMFVDHQAFGMDWNAQSHFLDNLLSCNEVRSELEQQFGQ
ncbi:hypothetical protein [Paenibacillus marinisediminis]